MASLAVPLFLVPAMGNSFQSTLGTATGRQRLADALKALGSERYTALLSKSLDQIDLALSKTKFKAKDTGVADIAWSAGAMRLSLRLAVVYPIFFLLMQWAFLGTPISINEIDILPHQPEPFSRWAVLILFSIALWMLPINGESDADPEFNENDQIEVPPSALISLLLVPALLFGAVVAFNGRSEIIVGLLAIVLAARASGLVAVSFSVLIAFFVSEQMAWFFPMTIAISIAFVLQSRLGTKFKRPLLFVCLYLFALLAILILWLIVAASDNNSAAILITLIAIFPILNTIFDFLSIGLTRACLRLGIKERRPAFYGLLDLLMGSVIFISLLCTMIAFFHFVRSGAGEPILPVSQFLLDANNEALPQVWFYVSLATTLIPTLLHSFFAFLVATPLLKLPILGESVEWVSNALGSDSEVKVNLAIAFGAAVFWIIFAAFIQIILLGLQQIAPALSGLGPLFQNFVATLILLITGEGA